MVLECERQQGEMKQKSGARNEQPSTELSGAKNDNQHISIDGEIAGLEAELSNDRDLLDMATRQGGIGAVDAIRRNKWLKARIRDRDSELDACKKHVTASYWVALLNTCQLTRPA
mmetsp:Transcript_30678/g.94901  ORF Transcript_30678/g.94901 Transcript_30678/m.94901 type:complete len:115 (-) Transcript_30678:1355-1699(-)